LIARARNRMIVRLLGWFMSKVSKQFRDKAAGELRDSREKVSSRSKSKSLKRAASYKALAENEEWLQGEKLRPKVRKPKVR
jgi:hypothetical protein